MISQAVEYTLRAMSLLSSQAGEPRTVQALSERGQIPAPYLAKLLQMMVRAGLVVSQRGVKGGYVLARDAREITLAQIINVVEPLQRITTCPLGISGHIQLCPLHRKLDQAMATVERAFNETTLADLLNENGGNIPLCHTQTVMALSGSVSGGTLPAAGATNTPPAKQPRKKAGNAGPKKKR